MNIVGLVGRLVRDPEMRHSAAGNAVASFTVAVNRPFTDIDGKREEDFVDCVAWRASNGVPERTVGKSREARGKRCDGRISMRPPPPGTQTTGIAGAGGEGANRGEGGTHGDGYPTRGDTTPGAVMRMPSASRQNGKLYLSCGDKASDPRQVGGVGRQGGLIEPLGVTDRPGAAVTPAHHVRLGPLGVRPPAVVDLADPEAATPSNALKPTLSP